MRGLAINRFGRSGELRPGGTLVTFAQIYLELRGTNRIEGNFLGPDVTGTAMAGNLQSGIYIYNSSGNVIGGTTAQARNVISGNKLTGLDLSLSSRNLIQGNFIGTDITGEQALGNDRGIHFADAGSNTLGGSTPGARNVISGNKGMGIGLTGSRSATNLIQGNFIGTDVSRRNALGNGSYGIALGLGTRNNTIGGAASDSGNTIAFNAADGVLVQNSTDGNAVRGNAIFLNKGLGIDLEPDGVNENDAGDMDSGANRRQNFPILTAEVSANGTLRVEGTLNSRTNAVFNLDFFSTVEPNPLGHGDGERLIGSARIATDASGEASFAETFAVTVPTGQFITATATDPANNTSEFSPCIPVTAGIPRPTLALARNGADRTLTLVWPASFGGFVLEATDGLMSPVVWTAVMNAAVVVGEQNRVTVPLAGGSAKFYRIRKP